MRNTADHQELTTVHERQKIALKHSSTQALKHSSTQALKARSVVLLFSLPLFLSGCGELRAQILGGSKISEIPSTASTTDVVLTTTLSVPIPAGEYDGIKTCSVSSPALTASNIKNGVTILGILGTYTGSGGGGGGGVSSALTSNIHRDSGQAAWSQSKESVDDAGQDYSLSVYRAIPNITKDDDGYTGTSVVSVDRTGWGGLTCGVYDAGNPTVNATIEDRIADCAGNGTIGANATWDGTVKGNAGQSVWKLVTRTADLHSSGRAREVWRDERTGLLWSSLVSGLACTDNENCNSTSPVDDGKNGLNWCKASGSNNITNNPTAQPDEYNDPINGLQTYNYCDNPSYQTTGTGPADKAVSACFEDGENFFTTNDAKIDNAGKAGLGYSSTPKVAWRLPNKYDYVQAEADGLRFVLPDNMNKNAYNVEWSASVISYVRSSAWGFSPDYGYFYNGSRLNSYSVRCVGR
jgi:hypothetical protein